MYPNAVSKSCFMSRLMEMGCCGCFGISRSTRRDIRPKKIAGFINNSSQDRLIETIIDEDEDEDDEEEVEDDPDDRQYNGGATNLTHMEDDGDMPSRAQRSEEVLNFRLQNGSICREFPVKVTSRLIRSEDENGNKMINEYVRECKIGSGSYAKVILCKSTKDGKHYAVKVFHKSHLLRQRVAPSETAMTDVLREVLIMKLLNHPNIVNLFEVIDDPNMDNFYMVLEYVEGKWDCEGSGPPGGLGEETARRYLRDIVAGLIYLHVHPPKRPGGLGEETARRYLRDIVAGLIYLHVHNIVHMDIKPQNLLVSRYGRVKIADFSVSQVFEDDNDELRRSPGTPVITAPECCLGLTYHGRAADTWAVGVTLYCMVMGNFPFIGETLQETYDKIVHDPLYLPDNINPQLRNLMEGILCKDPDERLTLNAVAEHPWVLGEEGPLPEFVCWCDLNKPKSQQQELGGSEKSLTEINEDNC